MNKLTIPTILVATVMVAGMFAFMPVEQASTVHTTGTTVAVIGAGGIGVGDFATASITADAIATNAIGSDELAATATTELQGLQLVTVASLDFSTTITCSATGASFLIHYQISDLADGEVITIGGTSTGTDLTLTADVLNGQTGPNTFSGTIGGAAGQDVTFDSSAATADLHLTIETATGATAVGCV